MKTLYLALLILCGCFSVTFAQEILAVVVPTNGSSKAEYAETVAADTLSKTTIYNRAREWFYKHYQSNKNQVQAEDKEGGKIVGKGATQFGNTNRKATGKSGYFSYTISFTCQNNRYGYSIQDISYQPSGMSAFVAGADLSAESPLKYHNHSQRSNQKQWQEMQYQADQELQTIIASLKQYIASAKDG